MTPSSAYVMNTVKDASALPHSTAISVLKAHTAMTLMVNAHYLAERTVFHTVLNATRVDPSKPLSVLSVRTDTSSTSSLDNVLNATTDVRLVTDQTTTTVLLVSQASTTKTQNVKSAI